MTKPTVPTAKKKPAGKPSSQPAAEAPATAAMPVTDLPLSVLSPDPGQPRVTLQRTLEAYRSGSRTLLETDEEGDDVVASPEDAFSRLVSSVFADGVHEPLLVREAGNGQYIIVAGERRYWAATEAKLKTVPVRVVEPQDTIKLRAMQLAENMVREDLNVFEKARSIAELAAEARATGISYSSVARSLGMSDPNFSHYRSIGETPEVMAALEGGYALANSERTAYLVTRLSPERRAKLLDRHKRHGTVVTRDEVRWELTKDQHDGKVDELERQGLITARDYYAAGLASATPKQADKVLDKALKQHCTVFDAKGLPATSRVVAEEPVEQSPSYSALASDEELLELRDSLLNISAGMPRDIPGLRPVDISLSQTEAAALLNYLGIEVGDLNSSTVAGALRDFLDRL